MTLSIMRALAAPLPQHRPVITGLFCDPELLVDCSNESTLHTHFVSSTPSRNDYVDDLTIGPAAFLALTQPIAATFDLIVSTPPPGMMLPSTGVTFPQARRTFGGTNRKLIAPGAAIPASLWCWLTINSMLTAAGQALFIVAKDEASRIEACDYFPRAWLCCDLGDRMAYFIGREHRIGPRGVLPRDLTLTNIQRHFHGTKMHHGLGDPNARSLFNCLRDEHARQCRPRVEFNVVLNNGHVSAHLTIYQRRDLRIPEEVKDAVVAISGRTPAELVITASTRAALQLVVNSRHLRIPPDLPKVAQAALEDYRVAGVPFTRPRLAQRIAWLDDSGTVPCIKPLPPFRPGRAYAVTSTTFQGRKLEQRLTAEGGFEEVLTYGEELMVLIEDPSDKSLSGFTQHPLNPEGMKELSDARPTLTRFHVLGELLEHFAMPDVPDITELRPGDYAANLRAVEALETA